MITEDSFNKASQAIQINQEGKKLTDQDIVYAKKHDKMRSEILKKVLNGESTGEGDPFKKHFRAHITVWYNGEPMISFQCEVSEKCTPTLELFFKDKITVEYEPLT